MKDKIFANESEHLYMKLCAAQEVLSNSKNVDEENCVISIMQNVVKDIDNTGDNELIEKVGKKYIRENDTDLITVQKGMKKIIRCAIIAIIAVVGALLASYITHTLAQKGYESCRDELEQAFRNDFEQKIEDTINRGECEEYHVESITYEINDIILYAGKEAYIIVSLDATFDAEKYDFYGYGWSSISFECYELCNRYNNHYNEELNGWRVYVYGTNTVNGKNCEYSSSSMELYDIDKDNDFRPYKDTKIPVICLISVGIIVAIVQICIIKRTKKKINQAKENMQGKTKLVLKKSDMRKYIICAFVVGGLVVIGLVAVFCVKQKQKHNAEGYIQAEEYFNANEYDLALSEYEKLGDYKDSEKKVQLIQCIQTQEYDKAIEICDSLSGDYSEIKNTLTEERDAYYYQNAKENFENQNYEDAKQYYSLIPGYLDSDTMLSQMDDYITYYDALEYESESIVGAVEIYKTLPSDFLDVSERIKKYEPYLACVGIAFGNPDGYITSGIKITDYSINSDGDMELHTYNLPSMVIESPTKSGYLFSVTDAKYGRTWNISEDKVTITVDGSDQDTWYK